MLPLHINTAKLVDFRAPTSRILFGDRLKAIKNMQRSILAHGLLNPIIVMQREDKLIVVDGKKRLAALRRLRFAGALPRSLVNVPYILAEAADAPTEMMALLSHRERFEKVVNLRRSGLGLMEIAAELYITKQCIKDLLGITLLSPRLRQAYFGGTISTAQARAFATLPNMDAQDSLLIALGPFAAAPDILTAIQAGETVLDMGDDTVIILPSRRPFTPYQAGPKDLAA
jgi:hypothetical protein